MRRVLDDARMRKETLQRLHEELGHKGREATYNLLATRYYWLGMYDETAKFVRACFECQARDPVRLHEPAGSARPMRIWEKWYIDTTPLPNEEGQKGVI